MKRLEYHPQVEKDGSDNQTKEATCPVSDDFLKFRDLLIKKVANAMSLPAGAYIDLPKDRR
tara:strand:- start:29881 stop:30063 length:183 start_codon:yes stop_codon:yes gene_type:complete